MRQCPTSPGPYPVDELRLSVSELEDVVKRKTVALKASSQRRERVEETAKAETAQARVAAELARSALEEAGRKGSSLRERAKDAETQVRAAWKLVEMGVTYINIEYVTTIVFVL